MTPEQFIESKEREAIEHIRKLWLKLFRLFGFRVVRIKSIREMRDGKWRQIPVGWPFRIMRLLPLPKEPLKFE